MASKEIWSAIKAGFWSPPGKVMTVLVSNVGMSILSSQLYDEAKKIDPAGSFAWANLLRAESFKWFLVGVLALAVFLVLLYKNEFSLSQEIAGQRELRDYVRKHNLEAYAKKVEILISNARTKEELVSLEELMR